MRGLLSELPILAGRDTTFCLDAVLTCQPFRERSGTHSNLCAPQVRTEEPDLGRKFSLCNSPRLAFFDYLVLSGPEQPPIGRRSRPCRVRLLSLVGKLAPEFGVSLKGVLALR